MTFPDQLRDAQLIVETDLQEFAITGYRDGLVVGTWSMADLAPGTSWNLNFLPGEKRFATGGRSDTGQGQQWNANGNATDCGNPGFGFNAGASAQDLCLDGQFIAESGIAPETPFLAKPILVPIACGSGGLVALLAAPDQVLTP